jgi:two-component system response regulator FixJ
METLGTVFVVDDDAEVRQSWECVLAAADLPTKSYATAEDFLADADCDQPCCLILDLRMPGMGGAELLETLRRRSSTVPVIVVSGHADVPTVIRSMKLGLVDFLTKPLDPALIVAKVRATLQTAAVAGARQREVELAKARIAALTAREQQVYRLLICGRLHKQIARELGISARTVDHHRAQINLMLQADNLADLMRVAWLAGLTLASAPGSLPDLG